MSTIRTAIALYDGFTSPLSSMNKAMNIILNSFEAMQVASGNAVDVSAIQQAREELVKTETTLDGIEQNIRRADNAQKQFNNDIRGGSSAAEGLLGKIKRIAAAVGGMMGIQKILNFSDELAGAKARVTLIVDDGGSVAAFEEKVRQSALRVGADYLDTLQTVSKLGLMAGNAFSNNDQMIRFVELMNKNFIIGGASVQEMSSAMYQLTQAMASGRLQGDEYRAIIENAPLLAKAIEDYMRNVQGATGTMKEWAAAGKLTAGVIINSLFYAADEIDARFENMSKTWGRIWNNMKTNAVIIFEPILTKINEIANTEKFNAVIDGIVNGLAGIGMIATDVFDLMVNISSGIADNWSWISPIIFGVVTALMIYKGVSLAVAIMNGIMAFSEIAKAAAQGIATGATFAATTAQYGLNAALYACPIFWIIILIIALIAIFYAVIAAVNHFAGTTISATGLICGSFMFLLASIGNILIAFYNLVVDVFVLIWNLVAMVANFIGNVFNDPIGAICRLFFGLADTVLGILEALAGAIDTLFGSNLAGAVSGWRKQLGGWVEGTYGSGVEYATILNAADLRLDRIDTFDAFNSGYTFGQGLDETLGNLFNFGQAPSGGGFADAFDDIINNTGDTAGNTAAMANALDFAQEDLKYLRDIAEREAINRFTTAEINIEQHNENHIASDVDVDGVMERMTKDFSERLDISAEGVHE